MHSFKRRVGTVLGSVVGAILAATSVVVPITVAQTPSAGAGAQPPASALASAKAPLVLTDVTVIDVENGRKLPRQTVVIAGTRIQALGGPGQVKVPAGARVVSARGKYLIPGLWDLHVHPLQFEDLAYPLLVAYGVTGMRDAGSNVPLATFNRWKQEIAAGGRVGPRLIVSGQSLRSPPGHWLKGSSAKEATCLKEKEGSPHQLCVATPEEARLVVAVYRMAGADMIKTYTLSPELYLAVAAEARRLNMLFGGHAYLGGLEASDNGAAILDHNTWFRPNVCGDLGAGDGAPMAASLETCTTAAQRLRRNNTWVAWGMGGRLRSVYGRYLPGLSAEQRRDMTADSVAAREPQSTADWAKADGYWACSRCPEAALREQPHDSALRRMHAAGIPIVVGTDAFASEIFPLFGHSVHVTLVKAVVDMGMTPLEALQIATLNPAKALRLTDSLGTVEAGKLADLVLLDADPLEDIWNTTKIRAVVANGRYFDRAQLDELLHGAEQVARSLLPKKWNVWNR